MLFFKRAAYLKDVFNPHWSEGYHDDRALGADARITDV